MYLILNSRNGWNIIYDQMFINIFIYSKYIMIIMYNIVSDIDNY